MLDVISKCFEQPDEIRTFLSKALPQVIVVQTDVNWAVSTSGYTPLFVPVEAPALQK